MCNAASLKTFLGKTHPCEKPYKGKEYSQLKVKVQRQQSQVLVVLSYYKFTIANISGKATGRLSSQRESRTSILLQKANRELASTANPKVPPHVHYDSINSQSKNTCK